MSVSLQKGQKVELKKDSGGALTSVMVGLGWDEAQPEKGGFFKSLFSSTEEIDCDASAIICQGGKLVSNADLVYFGNLKHRSGCVTHMGDNLTGNGEGDDEQILVNLQQLPPEYDKIVFVVNIFECTSRKQHFGMIRNCFIRICDDKGQEMCRYNLSENYDNMTAMIFGELYRHNGAWKFNAIGQGTSDTGIRVLAERFK